MGKYTNRDGDVYTFTKEEGDTVLWEGEFKSFRMSHPLVFKEAYQQYCKDTNTYGEGDYPMHIDEFKEVINQSWSKTKWGNHHTNIQTMSDNGWLLYLLKDRTKVDLLSDIDWENTHIGLLK